LYLLESMHKSSEHIEQVLQQCIQENKINRIESFVILKNILLKIQKQNKIRFSCMTYQWYIVGIFICALMMLGMYIYRQQQYAYALAIRQGRYEDAMAMKQELVPYQKGYEEIV